MKMLERVCLVNFYLMDRQDLTIEQVTALIGPNGSGKSSILDAIQIALLGGNGNYVTLNAQADDQGKTTNRSRTIRQYCLGQHGVEEGEVARQVATTYITLVFRDTKTGEPISLGVCLEAALNRDGHNVSGRYLLHGVELSMSDHLELVDGQERPRDWSVFRHQLQQRARAGGGEQDPVFADSDKFINAHLLALRGEGGKPALETFRRALRFVMRMRFSKTVDELVREQILESRPTEIAKFKEVMESFRRLAELVATVERKINEGEAIESDYARATAASRNAATWTGLAAAVRLEIANTAHDAAATAADVATDDLATIQADIAATESNLTRAQDEAHRVKQLRERHAAHAQHGLAQSQIEEQTLAAAKAEDELVRTMGMIGRTMRDAAESNLVAPCAAELRQAAQPVLQWQAALAPADRTRDRLRAILKPALDIVKTAFGELFRGNGAIERDVQSAKAEIGGIEANLQRVARGQSPLSNNVQQLITALQDNGLAPVPVCDLARVTDVEWQSAIEAYLGMSAQALLMPSADEERRAFNVYEKSSVYGVKIVVARRYMQRRGPAAGSVAELIAGTDPVAVAYLQARFGDMRRAVGDKALDEERALTKTGMLVGGDQERLHPVAPHNFRLGAKSGREQRETLQRQLQAARTELARLEELQQRATNLAHSLRLIAGPEEALERMLALFDRAQAARATIQSLREQLSAGADEEYVRLGEQERAATAAASELATRATALATKLGGATEIERQRKVAAATAKAAAADASVASDNARAHPEYDAGAAATHWDGLLEKFPDDTAAMLAACDEHVFNSNRSCRSAITAGTNKLVTFALAHGEALPPEARDEEDSEAWRKAATWMHDLLERLRNTDLLTYKQQMQDAYETSQSTFRNDVAMKLYENLERLDRTMSELNEVLRSCPAFTNGERYAFRRTLRPAHENLHRFIRDVGSNSGEQDLLADPNQLPPEFRELLEQRSLLGGAGVKSPLDDYREFFVFDIEILREDPITKVPKHLSMLSKRLDLSSGGEHRAPVYVIAGAALASAYRMTRNAAPGMALMLLDEAFDKMDPTNIIATMRYLEDLGLQLIVAGPGDKLPALNPFLYRYYDIARDADSQAVAFDAHSITEEARQLNRSDLPEFNPDLIQEEMMEMARAANRQALAA